mgnify:CR=1 FL=1
MGWGLLRYARLLVILIVITAPDIVIACTGDRFVDDRPAAHCVDGGNVDRT